MGYYIEDRLEDLSGLSPLAPYMAFHKVWGTNFRTLENKDAITFLALQFTRFSDRAIREYNDARKHFKGCYEEPQFPLSSLIFLQDYFEGCVISAYLSLEYLDVIRRTRHIPPEVKGAFSDEAKTVVEHYKDKLEAVRNAILHSHRQIISNEGKIDDRRVLRCDGYEEQRDEDRIKIFDRLCIEGEELRFEDITRTLRRMHTCASKLLEAGFS